MTTPTNRPPDDRLEERLAGSFDRAVKRAELDLADGRLAADAIDRGRRPVRTGAIWRAGLVLAAVAVLGAGSLWLVGSRPSPSPSPAPSLAAAVPSGSAEPVPYVTESLLPTDANGSQMPQPASSDQGLPIGHSFPPTVNGATVHVVGPDANAAIAAAADDSPILVSGWYVPTLGKGCDFDPGSPAPGFIYFKTCAGLPLAATPDGPEALRVYLSLGANTTFTANPTLAEVQQVLLRVHVHDPGCNAADCQSKPVVDATVDLGGPRLAPAVIAQTMPPTMITVAQAIDSARSSAGDMLGTKALVLVRVQAGPSLLFAAQLSNPDQYGPWVYVVTFVTPDGSDYCAVYVDAVTGGSSETRGGSGDGLSNP